MAVAYIAGLLNDSAFNYRLKIEIEKLKPQIKVRLISQMAQDAPAASLQVNFIYG